MPAELEEKTRNHRCPRSQSETNFTGILKTSKLDVGGNLARERREILESKLQRVEIIISGRHTGQS